MSASTSRADPSMFLVLHAALRTDAHRLVTALERLAPAEHRRARALHRWYRELHRQLHAHHRAEDEIFFPALARRVPDFVGGDGAHMADDHRFLDALTDRVGDRLAALADSNGRPPWPSTAAVGDATALAALLDDHVEHEERSVVPRFAEYVDATEFARLSAQADRLHGVRDLRFALPWFFDHLDRCDGELRERALAQVPTVMRVIAAALGPRYRRLLRSAGIA